MLPEKGGIFKLSHFDFTRDLLVLQLLRMISGNLHDWYVTVCVRNEEWLTLAGLQSN
jgi:hypothetical protein